MGAKVKMKCPRCHKMFRAANPRQNLCDECAAKERKERAARAAGKAASDKTASQAPKAVTPPKITGPGAGILVPGMTPPVSDAPPPELGPLGAAARRQEEIARRADHSQQRTGLGRPQHTPEPIHSAPPGSQGIAALRATQPQHQPQTQQASQQQAPQQQAPQQQAPQEQKASRDVKSARPQRAPSVPRLPKEPRPAPQPFQMTDELRERIEARYLELAKPVEFDGIRTQIAGELSVPKAAVKKVVAELLKRKQLPSWWELQASTSTPEELERIRAAYTPLLPTPPIGVHKQLATELGMDARQVYQGIRRIRAELRLPQYNPPEAHPEAPMAAPKEAKESEPARA